MSKNEYSTEPQQALESYIVRNWEGKVYAVTTSLQAAQTVVRLCRDHLTAGEPLLIINSGIVYLMEDWLGLLTLAVSRSRVLLTSANGERKW
jgi:hypothetical protein